MSELILKENELIITFRKTVERNPKKKIAWDLNLLSMDGFCDRGWIRVDLKPLYTLHITYGNIRKKTPIIEQDQIKDYQEIDGEVFQKI